MTEQPKENNKLSLYGIAYCLSHSDLYENEARLAMGGYFQLGSFSLKEQLAVEKYINDQLNLKLDSYQSSGTTAYLMTCLDILESENYKKL